MATAPDKPTCHTCRFAHSYETGSGPERSVVMRCMRHAPSISPKDGKSMNPLCPPSLWCGDYDRSPSLPAPTRGHSKDCACVECIKRLPCSARWNALTPVMRALLERNDPKEAAALRRAAGVQEGS